MIMVADGITQGNFETTQDVRSFDHGHAAVVEVAGATVGRVTLSRGGSGQSTFGRCRDHSCRMLHTGVVLSGRLHIRMDDGREAEAGAGEAVLISPGHDAWVLGDEPVVMIDWTGMAPPPNTTAEVSPVASSTTR